VQTQRQSVTGTRSIIATLDEARAATQQVAFAARRLLTMYTQDLEPAVYDQPQFLETVKKLVLAKSYAKVRVLLADPVAGRLRGSKFVHLAAPHHEPHRDSPREVRQPRQPVGLPDRRRPRPRLSSAGLPLGGHPRDERPLVARRYLNYFDEIWIASEPEAETAPAAPLEGSGRLR
jgi:hypothetical protein